MLCFQTHRALDSSDTIANTDTQAVGKKGKKVTGLLSSSGVSKPAKVAKVSPTSLHACAAMEKTSVLHMHPQPCAAIVKPQCTAS